LLEKLKDTSQTSLDNFTIYVYTYIMSKQIPKINLIGVSQVPVTCMFLLRQLLCGNKLKLR
jgi:hypothetical protein